MDIVKAYKSYSKLPAKLQARLGGVIKKDTRDAIYGIVETLYSVTDSDLVVSERTQPDLESGTFASYYKVFTNAASYQAYQYATSNSQPRRKINKNLKAWAKNLSYTL